MVVIPVLMLATMSLGPADGPFISGMVNMLKGMALVCRPFSVS